MNTAPLKQFMSRVKTAARAKTAEVRLPISEANELAATIAELLVEVMEHREAAAPPRPVERPSKIVLDGGSLDGGSLKD